MKTRRRFTKEFKEQAVEMVANGRPVPEIAEDLEIGSSILYRWVRQAKPQPTQFGSGGLRAVGEEAGADELRRLRREIDQLKRENNILKKAAVILGTEPQTRPVK